MAIALNEAFGKPAHGDGSAGPALGGEKERGPGALYRYRLNLLLLVVLLLLTTFWFYRHLHLYVTESLLIGGTFTLWGAWKIVQSNLQIWLGKETSAWTEQFLGRSGATEYLIFALVILGVLFAWTSSIYLKYEGASPGESEFQLDVLQEGNPYVASLEVTSFQRVAGRPYLFRWGFPELEFVITAPGGYRPVQRRFRPWSAIHLRVPGDFEMKTFHVLRLIPGSKRGALRNYSLPAPGSDSGVNWYLSVEINGTELAPIRNLRFQTLFAGAGLDDLERIVGGADRQRFERTLEGYLVDLNIPEPGWQSYLTRWQADPRLVATEELNEGDRVCLAVGKEGEEPLTRDCVDVSGEPLQDVRF